MRDAVAPSSRLTPLDRASALGLLAAWADFQQERSQLEHVVARGGHLCLFLPKYHCELNFIERRARARACR